MKFTVNREKLQKALQKVGSTIGSKNMLPVLGNVLLKAENNTLSLTTTDLEIRISTNIEAVVEEAGTCTAPAKKLTSLVGCFVGSDVAFNIDDKDHIKIKCGTSSFTLLGLPVDDFPVPANFEAKQEIKIKENELKRMIGSISYAASFDDSRKILTGILISMRNNMITLVATDGKRLAMQDKMPEQLTGGDNDVVIPLKAALEMRRLLEGDTVMTVKVGEKQCVFAAGNFELSTKIIEGNYPNYRQVIPQSFIRSITVPSALLLSKIETVSLVLSDSSSFIILDIDNNKLTLKASSSEVGEGSDIVEVKYEGEPLQISFNPAFLADPLKNCQADNVVLKMNDPLNPVVIEGNEGFLYVIMPIRKK